MEDENKPVEQVEQPKSVLEQSKEVAERMEAANKRTEELLSKQEQLAGDQLLAGTSGAGVARVEPTEDQVKTQQAKEFWKGTGLGEAIEKANG